MKQMAFVFPGQGSQQVGMLKTLADAFPMVQQTFTEASDVLQKDIWELVRNGPSEALNQTINTQPALLTASVAIWRIWQANGGADPILMAGHSLGEYSALVCSKALAFQDALRLVEKRGEFMQHAVKPGFGAMAAVIGLDNDALAQACFDAQQGEVVAPVNFNAIGQTVIAGHTKAVERASLLAKERGAKRVIPLPVSVPSHCALMKDAAEQLARALKNISITTPQIAVIHNVDVSFSDNPDDIRRRLVEQLYNPVRWVETIQRMAKQGVTVTIECGPGKVLTGLIKRIDDSIQAVGIETPQELTTALELL